MKKIYLAFLFCLILGPTLVFGANVLDSYPESNYDFTRTNQLLNDYRWAQSFTPSASEKLSSVKVYIKNSTSATGHIQVELYSHSGSYGSTGVPGTLLATSDQIDTSTVPSSLTLVEFTFSGANKYDLVSGTNYFLVVHSPDAGVSQGAQIGEDNTSPTHGGNFATSLNGGSSYTARSTEDAIFYVYGEVSIPTFSLSPNTGTDISDMLNVSCGTFTGTQSVILYFPDGTQAGAINSDLWCGNDVSVGDIFGNENKVEHNGNYKAVYTPVQENCTLGDPTPTYIDCLATSGAYDYGTVFTFNYSSPASPTLSGLAGIFSVATSTFAEATGIEYTDVTGWSGNMIKLVIGSGLGMLSGLMPWIIAILVFVSILFLIFKGFRFMRH